LTTAGKAERSLTIGIGRMAAFSKVSEGVGGSQKFAVPLGVGLEALEHAGGSPARRCALFEESNRMGKERPAGREGPLKTGRTRDGARQQVKGIEDYVAGDRFKVSVRPSVKRGTRNCSPLNRGLVAARARTKD